MAPSIRVLYVDDDATRTGRVTAALERREGRFDVETATDARQALDRLPGSGIDCVVSEYALPGRDGVAFLEAVREQYCTLPFVLFTDMGSESTASAAISAGVTDYLRKSSETNPCGVLAARIVDHVERTRRRRGQRFLGDDGARNGIGDVEAPSIPKPSNVGAAGSTRVRTSASPVVGSEAPVEETGEEVAGTVPGGELDPGSVAGIAAGRIDSAPDGRVTDPEIEMRAMDAAPVGIVLVDPTRPDNHIVYANEGFERLTGYSRAEVLGRDPRFLEGERTRTDPVAELREAVESGEPASVELRTYRKDGSVFWNSVVVAPVRDDRGELTHYVAFQRDVTDRKESERERALFRKAVERAGHGVVITDRDGTIEYVNPAYERDTGYPREDVVGRNPRIVKSGKHDRGFYEGMWETILSNEIWEADIVNRRKSGALYRVDQTIAPITDEDGKITHFVGIESDSTDRWLREQRLDVLNRILRHNVRNGMNVVRASVTLVEDVLDRDLRDALDPAVRELFDDCHPELLDRSLQNLLDRNVRSYARAVDDCATELIDLGEKAGTVRELFAHETDPDATCDVTALLAELEAEFEETYPDASITVSAADAVEVHADGRLASAIQEAVDNAVVHHDRSRPEVRVRVARPDGFDNWVEIRIVDTGPGVPADERTVIEAGKETPLVHGTGIGLWLVHWVVASFGGEVRIEDNDPRGSVVTLRLPVAPAER